MQCWTLELANLLIGWEVASGRWNNVLMAGMEELAEPEQRCGCEDDLELFTG